MCLCFLSVAGITNGRAGFKCISITRLGCTQETLNSHRKIPLRCPAINRSAYKDADLIIITKEKKKDKKIHAEELLI